MLWQQVLTVPLTFVSNPKPRAGFTLLELSIVLVIIGLLIGGIFVGQSLIHNAQLNAVITEFNRYQTAVQSFKQQYQALPGDMSNATQFWAAQNGTPATCRTTASTTAATCDGNGDGFIADSTGSIEYFRFWQHLTNAKMIEGSYTGVGSATTTVGVTAGVNSPASKFGSSSGWSVTVATTHNTAGDPWWFAGDWGSGHVFLFGSSDPANNFMSDPALSPKDAWSLDKKIDDGKPGQGNVMSYWSNGCSNAADATHVEAIYSLSATSKLCGVVIIVSF